MRIRDVAILAAVLALALWAAARPSFGQTVEVTPSTQPATQVDGVFVQPPPTVKVHGAWTPEAVLTVITAVSLTLIPAIIALWKAIRTEAKTDAATARLDRQGEVQTTILRNMPPSGGGGGASSST